MPYIDKKTGVKRKGRRKKPVTISPISPVLMKEFPVGEYDYAEDVGTKAQPLIYDDFYEPERGEIFLSAPLIKPVDNDLKEIEDLRDRITLLENDNATLKSLLVSKNAMIKVQNRKIKALEEIVQKYESEVQRRTELVQNPDFLEIV